MIYIQRDTISLFLSYLLDKDHIIHRIIDVVATNDTNIANKGIEKFTNYIDFKVEMARLFAMPEENINVIAVLVGALGSILLKMADSMTRNECHTNLGSSQNWLFFKNCA